MNEETDPKAYTHLTLDERKAIKSWIDKGCSLHSIAPKIKRGKNCIVSEVRRNGGRDLYDPCLAHKNAIQRKKDRDEKCRIAAKKGENPYIRMSEKIQILEMQIQIIFDMIEELKNDQRNQ